MHSFLKQMLTKVARSELLPKSYLVRPDLNDGITFDKLLLPQSWTFFCITSDVGVSDFNSSISFISKSSQLVGFSTNLQDSGRQNYFKMLATGLFSHSPVHAIVIFRCLIKRGTIFYFQTPAQIPLKRFKPQQSYSKCSLLAGVNGVLEACGYAEGSDTNMLQLRLYGNIDLP